MNFIDLFAGAGGLSEGFIKQGAKPIAHVELDKAACYTLKTRVVYHHLVENGKADIYKSYLRGDISRAKLYSEVKDGLLDSVINAAIGKDNDTIFQYIDKALNEANVDLIIGGPPCQAYSVVGRAPLKHRTDDERTRLYIEYGRFLDRYKPKMFVFENVPGLLSAAEGRYFSDLKEYFSGLGYVMEQKMLNSHDYGVVQRRERVIIIGWQEKLNLSYPDIKPIKEKYFRDDLFSDLPAIAPGESARVQPYAAPTNHYLEHTAIRNGVEFVTQHVSRPHNPKDLEIYRMAIERMEKGERLKNDEIPVHKRTQKNVSSFLDRFKVVDKVPHTMIAHISKDGHHFIHPDKKQLRSISVREAARIQSFPDDYYFEGVKEHQYRSAAFRQIGNAVPPLMAERIAASINRHLNGGRH